MSPEEIDACMAEAWQKQAGGEINAAMQLYRAVLAAMPQGHAGAQLGLGQCFLEQRQPDLALQHLRAALELAPQSGAIRHLVDSLAGNTTERAPDDYLRWVFDGHADTFDRHLAALKYRGPWMIRSLAEQAWLPDASRALLDIGCGTGLNGPLFRPYASRLDGIDLAPRMIEQAKRRQVAGQPAYDRLAVAEIHQFLEQIPAQVYDALLSTDVFIYIGRLERFFAQAARVLRPGGEILATIERGEATTPVQLMPTGRYRQSDSYIAELAASHGFRLADSLDAPLRVEQGVAEPGRAFRLVLGDSR
ncbi:methyltransferase domain-containing protein [Ferrovibrio sp.]|uniref:methyltransferase domain-containing protein n=1 Tax=Ferrovibrio sp. TaxID=1917215 RepID=UPI001B78D52B|nr:methyltransferase domain-containing protein [Ferrovibrio sp.]MBP7062539.1 methyltransferase domain-containing protein [Ferrovibrio sp.]